MSVDLAERALAALEDMADIEAVEAALLDPEPSIPLEDVARELGISLDE